MFFAAPPRGRPFSPHSLKLCPFYHVFGGCARAFFIKRHACLLKSLIKLFIQETVLSDYRQAERNRPGHLARACVCDCLKIRSDDRRGGRRSCGGGSHRYSRGRSCGSGPRPCSRRRSGGSGRGRCSRGRHSPYWCGRRWGRYSGRARRMPDWIQRRENWQIQFAGRRAGPYPQEAGFAPLENCIRPAKGRQGQAPCIGSVFCSYKRAPFDVRG